MHIRKGTEDDMPAVLELIKELAAFENEPDAVVITVADLLAMALAQTRYSKRLLLRLMV